MGYESLHITELLSVQCLQVYDVIPILSSAVYCGFGRCGSQRFAQWHYFSFSSLLPFFNAFMHVQSPGVQ